MLNTKNEEVKPIKLVKEVQKVSKVTNYKLPYFQNMYKKSVTIKVLCDCEMKEMQKIGKKFSAVNVREGSGGYIFEFKK